MFALFSLYSDVAPKCFCFDDEKSWKQEAKTKDVKGALKLIYWDKFGRVCWKGWYDFSHWCLHSFFQIDKDFRNTTFNHYSGWRRLCKLSSSLSDLYPVAVAEFIRLSSFLLTHNSTKHQTLLNTSCYQTQNPLNKNYGSPEQTIPPFKKVCIPLLANQCIVSAKTTTPQPLQPNTAIIHSWDAPQRLFYPPPH